MSLSISQLYTKHKSELNRYLGVKFGIEGAEAEDVVHVVFAKFAEQSDKRIENQRAYLYRMAHNYVIDQKKKAGLHDRYTSDYQVREEGFSTAEPTRIVSAQQQLTEIGKIIEKFPEQRKRILKMSRFDHLSNVEIAKRIGVTEAAVRKHLTKALLEIQAKLSLGSEG